MAAFIGYRVAASAAMFRVDSIDVTGTSRTSAEEIAGLTRRAVARTGRNYPHTVLPEVKCTCPVLPGPSIANLAGEMKGSCDRPKDGVWSLYSLAQSFPQNVNGTWQSSVPAKVQSCPRTSSNGKLNLYGQCFSYSCRNLHRENDIELADCYCPGLVVVGSQRTFATQAGQCGVQVCSEIPVGGPFQLPPGTCDQ